MLSKMAHFRCSLGLVQNKTSKSLECLQQWNCVIEQVIHKLQYVNFETLQIELIVRGNTR